MKRYCKNCQKEYEFNPVAVSGGEKLICPDCGSLIDKNSRAPVDRSEMNKTERKIGNFLAVIFRIAYVFFMVLALVGIFGFIFHLNMVLYITTAISLLVFLIQLITGRLAFWLGILFLPMGAAAGYFFMGGIEGACLGVQAVFLLRYLLRELYFKLYRWLIRLGN